jgi:hypothetical protein
MGWGGELCIMAALPPRKELTVPTEQEAGWAVELVWVFWIRENVFALPGN